MLTGVQKWPGVNIRYQEVMQQRFMNGGGKIANGGAKVAGCKYYTPRSCITHIHETYLPR